MLIYYKADIASLGLVCTCTYYSMLSGQISYRFSVFALFVQLLKKLELL